MKIPAFLLRRHHSDLNYWDARYKNNGNSGAGSYGEVADYKAQYLNKLIKESGSASAIEFGCGDGNNLGLYEFSEYLGLDLSNEAIKMCKIKYDRDRSKSFSIYNPLYFKPGVSFEKDIALSLDVLYHITDVNIATKYCQDVFGCAKKFAVFFTNDWEKFQKTATASHIQLYKVSELFSQFKDFGLVARDPCPFKDKSSAEMFVFKRIDIK